MEWVFQNWELILAAWAAVIGAAQAIVRLTPTEKDDRIVKQVAFEVGKVAEKIRNLATLRAPSGSSRDTQQ